MSKAEHVTARPQQYRFAIFGSRTFRGSRIMSSCVPQFAR